MPNQAASFSSRRGWLGSRLLGNMAAAAPLVAILLIGVLIGLFLWMTERERRQEQHVNLLRDTLWVEQALRFQLGTHQDNLLRLATDLSLVPQPEVDRDVLSRMRHLVANHPELLQIVLLDERGWPRVAVPPQGATAAEEGSRDRPPQDAWRLMGGIAPAWSPPRKQGGRLVSYLRLPVAMENGTTGLLEATMALDELLATQVPWWIAEHYQVSLTGLDGEPLANKSNVEQEPGGAKHSMSFDPPFHGIFLTLTPHRMPRNPLHMLLIAVIVGLALLAVVNLGLLALHFKRRRQAERALLNEQLFRQAMQDSVTVGLRARDLNGKLLFANPAFCRMVGWPAEDIIGLTPPMPWWQPNLLSEIRERHQALRQVPTPHSFETLFRRRDGSDIQVMVYEAPLIDANGAHVGWIASIIDISDRRKAEAQASQQADRLQQTGRLITMGEMASTLAHELNQPLAAIASYCAGCQNMLGRGDLDPAMLATMLENLAAQNRRAGQIIRRIHDFVRKREPVRELCDLGRLVRETVHFASGDAQRQGVQLHCENEPKDLMVRVDPVLIEQVLLNLIRNAIEATLEHGARPALVQVALERQEDSCIVSVADNGGGVAPEMMASIFSPFATTKSAGMGMGLNICRSILEQHQGHLWFEARAGGGAVFLFSLPLRRTPANETAPSAGQQGIMESSE